MTQALSRAPLLACAALAASAAVGIVLARLAGRLVGRDVAATPVAAAAAALMLSLLATPLAPRPASLVLGWALLLLAATDIAALRLPDLVTLPLAPAGLAFAVIQGDGPMSHLAGLVAGFGVLFAVEAVHRWVRGRSGLGLGDAKLFAAAGAWLGWRALPPVLLVACGAGLAWAALRQIRHGASASALPLPFGAPLAAATWIVWLLEWRA